MATIPEAAPHPSFLLPVFAEVPKELDESRRRDAASGGGAGVPQPPHPPQPPQRPQPPRVPQRPQPPRVPRVMVNAPPDPAPAPPTDGAGTPAPAAKPDFAPLYRIRPFEDPDHDACRSLYTLGVLGGGGGGGGGARIDPDDPAHDIEDIRSAYLLDPLNGFWVAQITTAATDAAIDAAGRYRAHLPPGSKPGDLVGMIGVSHRDEGIGEIRRLRVHPAHRRRGIGSRLLETAIKHCRDAGFLKVQLDTFVDRDAAVKLFERFRFRHGRTRRTPQGRDLLYFYLDLYTRDEAPLPPYQLDDVLFEAE